MLYYCQTNILCMVVLMVMLLAIRNRKGSFTARRLIFIKLIGIVALVCVSDMTGWIAQGNVFPGARLINYVSNIVYDGAITWCCYMWLRYVDLHVKGLEYDFKRRNRLLAIPLGIMLLLLLIDPLTGLLFTIDEQNVYSRGSWLFIHWIISWGYLVYATIETFIQMRKTDSRAERAQLLPMLCFIVPPAVAAVLQMFFYGITVLQCGMTVAVLFIAVNLIMDDVSKDSLTGLNNRRALENYVIDQLHRSDSMLTVLMCDIDKFKYINDTYGHSVGDLVLKRMGELMKRVCGFGSRSLFLCRYGGDEFIICGFNLPEQEVTSIKEEVSRELEKMKDEYEGDVDFGISIGDAAGRCVNYDDVENLIRLADARMYQVKRGKDNVAR